ncbi:PadR family transcriptional regulator [Agromyces larvae]|uniref:PadR family transcriptional regulator n=1 Tax=Agromyces larvae TaxID=2929802 RepID=UPI0033902F85
MLAAIAATEQEGWPAYGYQLAKRIAGDSAVAALTGSIYKSLARHEAAGYVSSRWESLPGSMPDSRPRRRVYSLTENGKCLLEQSDEQSISGRAPSSSN